MDAILGWQLLCVTNWFHSIACWESKSESHLVVSDSLQPHGLQHARLPCPSLSPGVCSYSCPLSWWCSLTHLILCRPLLLLPSVFLTSESFSMTQLFASGSQSTGASASASILPMNLQGWFPLELTGLSPCSARDPQESSPAPQFKSINSLVLSLLYGPTLTSIHEYWKTIALTMWIFVRKVMSAF